MRTCPRVALSILSLIALNIIINRVRIGRSGVIYRRTLPPPSRRSAAMRLYAAGQSVGVGGPRPTRPFPTSPVSDQRSSPRHGRVDPRMARLKVPPANVSSAGFQTLARSNGMNLRLEGLSRLVGPRRARRWLRILATGRALRACRVSERTRANPTVSPNGPTSLSSPKQA